MVSKQEKPPVKKWWTNSNPKWSKISNWILQIH